MLTSDLLRYLDNGKLPKSFHPEEFIGDSAELLLYSSKVYNLIPALQTEGNIDGVMKYRELEQAARSFAALQDKIHDHIPVNDDAYFEATNNFHNLAEEIYYTRGLTPLEITQRVKTVGH